MQLAKLEQNIGLLFPDTSVLVIDSSGAILKNDMFAAGAVFTPNDENFELSGDNRRIPRYHIYFVDSIYFPYIYVRNIDSFNLGDQNTVVVDTLIVQFYKHPELEKGEFKNKSESEIYMKPADWDLNLLGSTRWSHQVKIPLTESDATPAPTAEGWTARGKIIALPDEFLIPDDFDFKNSFGFSLSYKPMLKNRRGDTLDALNLDRNNITNRLNYFGYSGYTNYSIPVLQTKYINNAWFTPGTLAYGDTIDTWYNSIPGNAYVNPRYLNYGVHITCCPMSIKNYKDDFSFDVYPNPARQNEPLKSTFYIVNASKVHAEIQDITGNLLKTISNEYYSAGSHSLITKISDLSPGIYFYKIQIGNSFATRKIMITN